MWERSTQKTMRLGYFAVILHALTDGRAYRGGHDSPAGFLMPTTTGRKSGQPCRVHLLYIRDGSAYVVTASIAGNAHHPGWF